MARTGDGASRFLFRALNETNLGIVVSNVEFWSCPLNDDGGVTEAQTKNPASLPQSRATYAGKELSGIPEILLLQAS